MSFFSRFFQKDWRLLPFEEVAPRIKALIVDGVAPPGAISRDLGDLSAVLAVDVRRKAVQIEQRDATRWGQSPDALWARAAQTLKDDPDVLVRPYELPLEIPLTVQLVTALSEFGAAQVLRLDEWGAGSGAGALVAVPSRDCAFYLPMVDRSVILKNVAIILAAGAMCDPSPAPLSPHVYWYHGGRFDRITDRPGGRGTLATLRNVPGLEETMLGLPETTGT